MQTKSKLILFAYRMFKVLTTQEYRGNYIDVLYGNVQTLYRQLLTRLNLTQHCAGMTRLQQFKNIHENDRCFIVCTGPSLKISDLEFLKNEYTFGVNHIFNAYDSTTWRPTYYVMCDASGYRRQETPWDFESYSTQNVFLNNRILQFQKGFTTKTVGFVFNHRTSEHYKDPTLKMRSEENIDICIYDRGTVTNAAIDIALYMGFKKIYLIGVDHNYNGKRHFAETEDDRKRKAPTQAHLDLTTDGYKESAKNAARHNASIYNATRGGSLEVFPRVEFESLFH